MQLTICMVYAWTCYYGVYWLVNANVTGFSKMMIEVVNTLITTAFAFANIFLVDRLKDQSWTGPKADMVCGQIVGALAILVGFGWEHCFDKATESLAEKLESLDALKGFPKCLPKLFLAFSICLMVIPAWRLYILRIVLEGTEEEEEETKMLEKETELLDKASAYAADKIRNWEAKGIECKWSNEELQESFLKKEERERIKKEDGEEPEEKKMCSSSLFLAGLTDSQLRQRLRVVEIANYRRSEENCMNQAGMFAQLQRVQELERHERILKDTIAGFQVEIEDLHKIADRLMDDTPAVG